MKHPLLIAGLGVLAFYVYQKSTHAAKGTMSTTHAIKYVPDYHIDPVAGKKSVQPIDCNACNDSPDAVIAKAPSFPGFDVFSNF